MFVVAVIPYGQRSVLIGCSSTGMSLRMEGCDAMVRRRTRSVSSALDSNGGRRVRIVFGREGVRYEMLRNSLKAWSYELLLNVSLR